MCCSFEPSIQRILKKKVSAKNVVFNNNNKKYSQAANQYISMISEGSCHTEDCPEES